MVKRSKDWGPAVFQQRLGEAWQRYAAWTDSWLEVVRGHGRDALAAAYDEVLNGRARPHQGHVLSLR